MTGCPFCNLDEAAEPLPTIGATDEPGEYTAFAAIGPPTLGRREPSATCAARVWRAFRRAVQWLVPTALLVLIPKCPICVAAYVALFTGVSVSIPAAEWIRGTMLALCGISLACLVIKRIFNFTKEQPCPSQSK